MTVLAVYEEREHVNGVGNFCARQHPNLLSQIGCRRINPLGSGCFTAEIGSLISMSVLRSPLPVCLCSSVSTLQLTYYPVESWSQVILSYPITMYYHDYPHKIKVGHNVVVYYDLL
jgi:hypothetical protein